MERTTREEFNPYLCNKSTDERILMDLDFSPDKEIYLRAGDSFIFIKILKDKGYNFNKDKLKSWIKCNIKHYEYFDNEQIISMLFNSGYVQELIKYKEYINIEEYKNKIKEFVMYLGGRYSEEHIIALNQLLKYFNLLKDPNISDLEHIRLEELNF